MANQSQMHCGDPKDIVPNHSQIFLSKGLKDNSHPNAQLMNKFGNAQLNQICPQASDCEGQRKNSYRKHTYIHSSQLLGIKASSSLF